MMMPSRRSSVPLQPSTGHRPDKVRSPDATGRGGRGFGGRGACPCMIKGGGDDVQVRHYQFDRITFDPEKCFGKACIRGLRFPVSSILAYLSSGIPAEHEPLPGAW